MSIELLDRKSLLDGGSASAAPGQSVSEGLYGRIGSLETRLARNERADAAVKALGNEGSGCSGGGPTPA